MWGSLHGLDGGGPPPLAYAAASDDVSALRPFVLARFHPLYYFPQKLRQHPRPRTRFRRTRFAQFALLLAFIIIVSSASVNTITANRFDFWGCGVFVRSGECEGTIDYPSREIRSSQWHVDAGEGEVRDSRERNKESSGVKDRWERIWWMSGGIELRAVTWRLSDGRVNERGVFMII